MSDLISRQNAIDKFESWLEVKGYSDGERNIIKAVLYELGNLPSAQQWIPCNQRMPKEHEWIGTKRFGTTISDEVYVTFESPDGVRFAKHLCFQNGKLSNHDQLTIDTFYKGAVPIAWMPLPEPWKGE